MAETIGEMILPGTYIDVRAEGLIGVGAISVGNIGVVGSASRGPLNEPVLLGSYGDAVSTFGAYDEWTTEAGKTPLSLTRTVQQLYKGGARSVYAVRVANAADVSTAEWTVTQADDSALFVLKASSPGSWANSLKVSVTRDGDTGPFALTVQHGAAKQSFEGANAGDLVREVNDAGDLVTAADPAAGDEVQEPKDVSQTKQGGPDGAAVTTTEVATGLGKLSKQPVHIVTVAGLPAKDVAATVLSHIEANENEGRDRIGVLGASSDDPAAIIATDVAAGSSGRLVLVAPGIEAADDARVGAADRSVTLPGAYAAALVARDETFPATRAAA